MPRKKTQIQLKCPCCQNDFWVHSYRAGKAKYCSLSCYTEHRWKTDGKCAHCGNPSPGKRFCSKDHQAAYWAEREKDRYPKRRAKQWADKLGIIADLGGECVECGISDPRVLDIDHINPNEKLRPDHRGYSTPIRLAYWRREMHNLQILCANCHRIKTHKETWKTAEFLAVE